MHMHLSCRLFLLSQRVSLNALIGGYNLESLPWETAPGHADCSPSAGHAPGWCIRCVRAAYSRLPDHTHRNGLAQPRQRFAFDGHGGGCCGCSRRRGAGQDAGQTPGARSLLSRCVHSCETRFLALPLQRILARFALRLDPLLLLAHLLCCQQRTDARRSSLCFLHLGIQSADKSSTWLSGAPEGDQAQQQSRAGLQKAEERPAERRVNNRSRKQERNRTIAGRAGASCTTSKLLSPAPAATLRRTRETSRRKTRKHAGTLRRTKGPSAHSAVGLGTGDAAARSAGNRRACSPGKSTAASAEASACG